MLKSSRSAVVTGATGFIGSSLVRRLSAEGWRVFCLVRAGAPGKSRVSNLPGVELLDLEDYDVSTLERKLAGIQADIVFNLASAGVAPGRYTPQELLSGNLGVVVALLSVVASWPVRRFIHVGSCSEYKCSHGPHGLTEDDPLQPLSLYGAAKACAHIYGATLALSQRVPFTTLRLFGVFGAGEAPHRLVPYIAHHLERDMAVDLTPGEQVRDLLYVTDAVEALMCGAVIEDPAPVSCYNVCSGKGIRIRQVAEEVAKKMNRPRDLLHFGARPYRPDESMWVVGDNKRFTALTGWFPKVSIEQGIQSMVSELGGGTHGVP